MKAPLVFFSPFPSRSHVYLCFFIPSRINLVAHPSHPSHPSPPPPTSCEVAVVWEFVRFVLLLNGTALSVHTQRFICTLCTGGANC